MNIIIKQCCKCIISDFKYKFYGISNEGLCIDCEFIFFRERFNYCIFCGYAIKNTVYCVNCESGFCDWLFDFFYNSIHDSHNKSSIYSCNKHNNDMLLWNHIVRGCIDIVYNTSKIDIESKVNNNKKNSISINNMIWPGFITDIVINGNNSYFKPNPIFFRTSINDIYKININDINHTNASNILLRELSNIGIYPYSQQVQYISD